MILAPSQIVSMPMLILILAPPIHTGFFHTPVANTFEMAKPSASTDGHYGNSSGWEAVGYDPCHESVKSFVNFHEFQIGEIALLYETFYYYCDDRLQVVRSGKWKLHVYRQNEGTAQILYDLESDLEETTDVSTQNPDIVNLLEELAENAREDLGDDVTGQEGNNPRPIGTLK